MTSEIRTNSLKSRAGLSTVTMTDSGPMFSGITTFVDNSGFTFGVGGGTSIFTPATNILTLGTNNTEKVRIDANGNTNITGVTTAANFKTGVSNLHDVGLTLSGGQIDVGSNIKIGTAGVVTATTFSGSGANLTNLPAANLTGTLPAISGANLTNLPTATTITVADESSDTTCYPLFATATSGNLAPKTGTNLTFNSSSGNLRTGSLFVGTGTNESKTQDGLIMERNGGDGEVHITAGRSGGNYSGMQFYVAGAQGVTKRYQIDYQSNFRWYDDDGTTEMARLTGTGRFGIGTASPDHIFEVESNNSSIAVSRDGANAQLLFKSNSVGQAGQIQVSESSGGGVMQFFNKNTSGVLRECFRLSPTNRTLSFFASGPSYPAGSSNDEQYYQFANSYAYNWTMRLRNYTWGYGLRIDTDDDSTREGLMIFSTKSGVNQSKASIHMDGTYRSRNNTYTSYSDIKLKENIVDAESQWNDIKGLKVRNFNFKIDDPSQKMIGVIAQEAETVCPNLVRDIPDTEEKDGEIHETGTHTKEVKYSILYMKAIKALQEAMTRIEKLEQDNIALRARVTNLEGN